LNIKAVKKTAKPNNVVNEKLDLTKLIEKLHKSVSQQKIPDETTDTSALVLEQLLLRVHPLFHDSTPATSPPVFY